MSFFDNTFLLLSPAQQTFVAAIATLVVLCSYKSSSNFLSELTNIFREIIRKDIKRKIEDLRKSLDFSFLEECDIYSHSSKVCATDQKSLLEIQFKADIIRNKFFNNAIAEKVNSSQVSFDSKTKSDDEKKPFPLLMAFFTFVMCVAVLSIDALNFNSIYSTFVLFLFDFVFLVITLAGWYDYWKDKLPLTDDKKNKNWILYSAVAIVLAMFVLKMPLCIEIVLLFIAILCCSWYLYYHITKKRKNDDFNIRYIAKFETKWMAIATIVAWVMYFAFNYSFLYRIMPIWIQSRFTVITDNYSLIESGIFVWRRLFIILCVLNSFILPLSLKFLYDKKNWHAIRTPIFAEFTNAETEINNLKNQYSNLRKTILSKQGAM